MPQQLEGHDLALQRIKGLVEEHFDSYVLIVGKNKNIWHMFNKGTDAYGMMARVSQKIHQSWVTDEKN